MKINKKWPGMDNLKNTISWDGLIFQNNSCYAVGDSKQEQFSIFRIVSLAFESESLKI